MSLRLSAVLSLFLGALCWGALAALVYYREPSALYFGTAVLLIVAAVAFTTAPLWGRVQQRITPSLPPEALPSMAARQGLWTGLFAAAVLLFHMFGLLDWVLVLVLVVLFAMFETFLQQQRQWRKVRKPSKPRARATPAAAQVQRTKRVKTGKKK